MRIIIEGKKGVKVISKNTILEGGKKLLDKIPVPKKELPKTTKRYNKRLVMKGLEIVTKYQELSGNLPQGYRNCSTPEEQMEYLEKVGKYKIAF
jgi:hypothetical protein